MTEQPKTTYLKDGADQNALHIAFTEDETRTIFQVAEWFARQ